VRFTTLRIKPPRSGIDPGAQLNCCLVEDAIFLHAADVTLDLKQTEIVLPFEKQ
jgi:hypothetical protein